MCFFGKACLPCSPARPGQSWSKAAVLAAWTLTKDIALNLGAVLETEPHSFLWKLLELPALTTSCVSDWANYLQLAADSFCSGDMLPRVCFKYEFSRQPISYLLHLLVIGTSHLNMPDVFHQDPYIIPWEINENGEEGPIAKLGSVPFIWIHTKSYLGLFWAKIHLCSKFYGNLISIFYVIMLTNQQTPVKTWRR